MLVHLRPEVCGLQQKPDCWPIVKNVFEDACVGLLQELSIHMLAWQHRRPHCGRHGKYTTQTACCMRYLCTMCTVRWRACTRPTLLAAASSSSPAFHQLPCGQHCRHSCCAAVSIVIHQLFFKCFHTIAIYEYLYRLLHGCSLGSSALAHMLATSKDKCRSLL